MLKVEGNEPFVKSKGKARKCAVKRFASSVPTSDGNRNRDAEGGASSYSKQSPTLIEAAEDKFKKTAAGRRTLG